MSKKFRLRLVLLSAGIVMSGNVAAASIGFRAEQSGMRLDGTNYLQMTGDEGNALTADSDNPAAFAASTQTVTSGRVPIPSAGWLFVSGLVGMVAVSRRNKGGL